MCGAGYCVIGWFRDGVYRGVVEVAADGSAAEASLSVEADWRNLGVGRGLMRRALRRARQAGCCRLVVLTAWHNPAMIRLAQSLGARLSSQDGDVVAELTPGSASLLELSFDLVDDRIGLVAAASDVLWSMAAAHPWRSLGRRASPLRPARRRDATAAPPRPVLRPLAFAPRHPRSEPVEARQPRTLQSPHTAPAWKTSF